MPQSVDTLPPPAVEWRRESDNERRERLERSGVLPPETLSNPSNDAFKAKTESPSWAPKELLSQAKEHKESTKKQYIWWWGADLGRWWALKSPRETRTITDGAFGINVELTHPQWMAGNFQFGLGPKAIFYHGGQYAKLQEPGFIGDGYAKFVSSELGLALNFTKHSEELENYLPGFWSMQLFYLPARWIQAEPSTNARMIVRSDTYSRTSLSLPGLGFQLSSGFAWSSMIKVEAFAAVQAAWPLQYRGRAGVQMSMALTSPSLSLVGP